MGGRNASPRFRASSPQRLEKKWKPLQPVITEEEPWIEPSTHDERSAFDHQPLFVHHFCPEVSYNIYHYFASDMFGFVDEDDRDLARLSYDRDGIKDPFDPRWETIVPRHYTECQEYSILATFATTKGPKPKRERESVTPRRRWQVLARDNFTCVYCGRRPPDVALHVDHKVSVKDGGSDEPDNLVSACDECNFGKAGSSV